MERENRDDTAGGGGESETQPVISSVRDDKEDELEGSAAKTKSDSVNEPGEAEHPEQNDTTTGGESEIKSLPSTTKERVLPELTLVLIGDTNSIEVGSKNILLDHDEQTQQFSSSLYDLCGRHISVINMLGQQNTDKFPLNQGVHAFLLLLPNGLQNSHYSSGVQWLEKTFGKESLAYLMTVVTHGSDEECDRALADLKANSSFVEKRYHTCTKSMREENEIAALLEKIDVMVSENDPHCYNGLTCGENKEHEEEETSDSSVFHQNQTADQMQNRGATTEIKCEPVNEPGDAENSEKNDESTKAGGEPEVMSTIPLASSEKGLDTSAGETDEDKQINNENSSNMSERSPEDCDTPRDTSSTSRTVSTVTKEHQQEERAATTEEKSDPVNDSGDAEAKEKGTFDMDMGGNMDQLSVKISEEINRKNQRQREIETLFHRLHLHNKHHQKLSPADFPKIGPPVKQDHDTSEKDLAHTFVQRLMMLDYRARYIPVRQDTAEVSQSTSVPVAENVNTEESVLDDFFSTSVDRGLSKQTHIHPMDIQMAVFHCSDSFLKQNMMTKLSQCQYALPLLVPDPVTMYIECPLWTFRKIRKTWKITQTKDNSNIITMKSLPICEAEIPMVSFFRLGSLSVSKSQLINSLINDRHNTFFHRNCPGSTKSRHLMDGVAEIAWYCPAGKPNAAFTDCTAFCNLHGDALTIEKQRDILIEKSSVNVVLLSTPKKGDKSAPVFSDLLKSSKPLICLIVDDSCDAVEVKKGKFKMGLKDRSQSDVSEELKRIIGEILSGPHTSFQLETMAKVSGIRVDEDDAVCQKGKSAAMKIMNLLQETNVSRIKDKFLPCQGRLWHEWCRINKELYHLRGNTEKDKSEKQKELMTIRQKQCDASCSELMKLFIESLSSLPSTDKEYFLKWTQILIDALSTDDLNSILQSYHDKWSEVLALKKKHDKSDQLNRKQTELEQISTKLQAATFGLEHIFREMGQIYEAHKSLQKQTQRRQTDWSKYPELAAELMISGHPMELMDGDAGHVPLTWISSLLEEVIKRLGDQRVFVLSVLGVQSSGKSTMLNAMFGSQFAVSAGRCTKGAFMQLVKVSEEMKKDFRFDYVLVVDTEGLRALELAGNTTPHHDNELATFVVGLGNMTLINIFGENPADMQDILQIVVQAFMRMKKVKLSPSCVFVHQNVTDIAAAQKNMDGKRRLQEKLDQMAQLAAKEEVCDAECFSDVIAFDVQKDVKYFAQLWEGSPPMAPPNPGYSDSVQELKNIILSKASQSPGITLSQFKSKVQDLWKALMNEHFVFSFKNTLEIKVYRNLEVQYGNWTWALRSNMLTIENQLYNRIENGKLDKVELSYLSKEMSKTYGEIKKEMRKYFDDDRDKEMLVQWRGQFENKIKEFHDEQVRGVKRKLDEVIQQKTACKKLDGQKTEFENKLLQKSKELAQQLKDKTQAEEELKKQFDSVWRGWVRELTADIKPIEDINLEDDQLTILEELGFEWAVIDGSKSSGRYKNISEIGDYSDYVTLTKYQEDCEENQQSEDEKKAKTCTKRQGGYSWRTPWVYFQTLIGFVPTQQKESHTSKRSLPFEEQNHFRSLTDELERQTIKIITNKPVPTSGYSPTYLLEVAKNVKEKVTAFESKRKYALKKEFTVDLLLYVFDRAKRWLSESHKKFKMKNDALIYLENKKHQYYNIFRSFCKGSSSAVVLGELICEKLKVSAVEAVCKKTAIDVAGEMRCSFPAFKGNRLNLEKHVLKSLAEKEDFRGFITYIHQPREQVERFIKEEVKKYIFTPHKDKARDILKKNVEDMKQFVSQALFTATERVKTQRGYTDMWLEEFTSLLKDELMFEAICSQNFRDINNFDFLKEEIEKGLVPIMKETSSLSLNNMSEFRLTPDQILIDQLCKCCWVTCPFCAAVCTNTIEDHSPDDHSVPFHRPSGINGWHYRGTVELVIDFCTTLVASDKFFHPHYDSDEIIPYKQYQKGGDKYAQWKITADESKLTYWIWFVCRFQEQLEDHYKLKFQGCGEIPGEWRKHSKEEAIQSLEAIYNQ
ncbi:interferon-induced very large GTPase 1-like isoform X5 [Trachinotus anak]|uniref:interferon-induced very large GTPase 1-like isoform X5 n=1 Tax=Trachinotus anak TaxID=443729 RepID=UPI0039F252FF